MARTLAQLRSESRLMIGQPDSDNSNFTDPQLNTWINEAYRMAVVALEVVPITENTYTLDDTVSLNGDTISVDIVKAYVRPANEWRELEVIDLETLVKVDPDWENAETNEPRYFVRTGVATARIYPPLNSANDAQATSLKTYGLELPTSLSADGDTTALPHNLDDILPHYVAYRCFQRLNESERSVAELTLFRGQLKAHKGISTQFSRKRKRWRWESQDEAHD